MLTPHNRLDGNVETQNASNMSVGDHVLQEGYEMGEQSIVDLLSENEKLVNKYTEQLCNHFGGVLSGLPEYLQESVINSIRVFNGKHDVLYQGMVSAYDNRANNQIA